MFLLRRIINDEQGQGLTEYALILGSISILVFFILLTGILMNTGNIYEDLANKISDLI